MTQAQCGPMAGHPTSAAALEQLSSWEEQASQGHFEAIPAPLGWSSSACFAHLLNGYTAMSSNGLSRLANDRIAKARLEGDWRGSARELWLCLFYEHRRWRHFGDAPQGEDEALLDLLCETLRRKLIATNAAGRAAIVALLAAHPFPGRQETDHGG
ncbi:MAG: hypothetical protein J0H14_16750 [Alphaproteobacteria bacterium]|nr:hypothetical protein [Alphaproteobacteria bacterium]